MLALFSAMKPTSSANEHLHETPTTPTGDFTKVSNEVTKASSLIVAGMDITNWQVVEVSVPAGPLGILLDGACIEAAVLDDFAPIAREGTPGAVEASGKVPHGSVLVGMDKVDFLKEPRKTLAEIGAVLREAAHLKRQLRFRVPPQGFDKAKQIAAPSVQENEKLRLFDGSTSSSTSLVDSGETSKSGEWGSWMWSGLRAATTLSATAARVESPESQNSAQPSVSDPALTMMPPPVKTTGRPPSFVRVTGMEDRALESDTRPFVPKASDKVVSVEVPPGSLGLNLDGSIATRAVVLGFVPLSDGSRGVLERNGSVVSGAELVEINGEDVSQEPLAGIRERLSLTSGAPRRLSFRLPPPPAPVSAPLPDQPQVNRQVSAVCMKRMSLVPQPVYTEDVELRRRLELKLVMSFDRKELKFKECWFAVPTEWMKRWVTFVGKGGPEPGSISTCDLLALGWEAYASDPERAAVVRAGLEITKDFRFVTPMVWALLTAIHGCGDAPAIARFALDINSEAVTQQDIDEILHDAKPQANGLATNLREKCRVETK